MMFINSGFAGGENKHGHFHRIQKSNLSDNDLELNRVYVPGNTKLIEEDRIPFPQFNLQTIHPGFKTMKDSHMVTIQALIEHLKMFIFSGKAQITDLDLELDPDFERLRERDRKIETSTY